MILVAFNTMGFMAIDKLDAAPSLSALESIRFTLVLEGKGFFDQIENNHIAQVLGFVL